jgi:large subunit ribosomal protein L10
MRAALETSESVYLTAFQGLTVAEANDLRGQLREAGGRMQVVKNRLLRLALQDTQFEPLAEVLTGPNAVTYCGSDPIEPLKVLTKFATDHGQPPVKAGVVEGRLLTVDELERLAKVPPRDRLMAEVVGAFAGPVYGLVHVLGGPVSDLVFTLQAIVDQKGGAQAA